MVSDKIFSKGALLYEKTSVYQKTNFFENIGVIGTAIVNNTQLAFGSFKSGIFQIAFKEA